MNWAVVRLNNSSAQMGTRVHSCQILVMATLLLFCFRLEARVHVFLGFMDDEVNEVLKTVLDSNQGQPVIAIQAGLARSVVFGRPTRFYSKMPPRFLSTQNPTQQKNTAAELSRMLNGTLHAQTFLDQLNEHLVPGNSRTVRDNVADPTLTLVSFTNDEGRGPVVKKKDLFVVLQSPEMGRQPGLFPLYLDAILRGLAALPEAKIENGGIHLSTLATGGGIRKEAKLGKKTTVDRSLFVGARVSQTEGSKSFLAQVALRSVHEAESQIFFQEAFRTRAEAEAAAKLALIEKGGTLVSPQTGKTLRQALKESHSKKDLSVSASFFVGPELKRATAKLGATSANMEDFHIIGIANDRVDSSRIVHVITDPPETPTPIRRAITLWAKTPGYTLQKYADAILWGLQGNPLDKVPETARWEAFDAIDFAPLRLADYFPSIGRSRNRTILDPFFAEIASEFLNELRRGTAFRSGPIELPSANGLVPDSLLNKLSSDAKRELERLVLQKSEALKISAQAIETLASRRPASPFLARRVRALLVEAAHLSLSKNGPLYGELLQAMKGPSWEKHREFLKSNSKICLLAEEPREMEGKPSQFPMGTWIVNQRWDGNHGRLLAKLGALNDSQVDRAVYRVGLATLSRPSTGQIARNELRRIEKTADSLRRRFGQSPNAAPSAHPHRKSQRCEWKPIEE